MNKVFKRTEKECDSCKKPFLTVRASVCKKCIDKERKRRLGSMFKGVYTDVGIRFYDTKK